MDVGLVALGFAWVAWCVLHSMLIHPPVEAWLSERLGVLRRALRLFYNLVAVITLVPLVLFTQVKTGPSLWVWPAWTWPFCLFARGAGLCLLVAGARAYGLGQFLGWSQVTGAVEPQRGRPVLVRRGILNHTRHPWYLAALLLLWSRDLAAADLLVNVTLTLYLILGTRLEESRLLALHGEAYGRYQREVPRFWPSWRISS